MLEMEWNKIYNMDCLDGMKMIPDKSIDCIICDLPYGITRNKWDTVIPLDKLWEQYNRIAKPNAAILLFSQQPFTTKIIGSNLKDFRYEIIWVKGRATGFLNANKMPLRCHENICVFYKHLPVYNPQKTHGGKAYKVHGSKKVTSNYGIFYQKDYDCPSGDRFPVDVIKYKSVVYGIHPTQKPLELIRYLVRTYTNRGGVCLDNCMGSGTTAIACIEEGRSFIGFENNKTFFDAANKRILEAQDKYSL